MNSDDLKALRELFRKKFREYNFCIGELEVEKVFRELLGEPKPTELTMRDHAIEHERLTAIVKNEMGHLPELQALFDRDDIFYKHFRK